MVKLTKCIVLVILILFAILLVIMGDKLLDELGAPVIVMLFGLIIWYFSYNETSLIRHEVKMRFYENHIEIRRKNIPAEDKTQDVTVMFRFDDVKDGGFSIDLKTNTLSFRGPGHITVSDYRVDGQKETAPVIDEESERISSSIWLEGKDVENVVAEIESHSPIRVERKTS